MSKEVHSNLITIKRASRLAAVLTLIGAVVVIGTLAYSAWTITDTEGRLQKLEQHRRTLEAELRKRQEELDLIRNSAQNLKTGISHYYEKQYDQAVESYNMVLAADPNNIMALQFKGQALMRDGRLKEALNSLEQSVRLDPTYVRGHYSLSEAYWRIGDVQRALDEVETTLELDPQYSYFFRVDTAFRPFINESVEFQSLLDSGQQELRFIQKALLVLGYYSDKVDGIPGKNTKEAITRYQQDRGLRITGLRWTDDDLVQICSDIGNLNSVQQRDRSLNEFCEEF